ncbi:uncharacterized protein LOC118446788 [Vespa mandarinia]|uniref:uncharacterized protein LOC118446788 n=1 Tax=Vespa mandarinia TaxID=7446 RepID=UPI00161A5D36|nr:uncharacterized protein LOC118446788 [Vespa mandarinia]
MSAEHHSGKGYTPLPQCMSNTDTEDEDEHVTQRNDLTNKQTNDERETTEPTTVHEHEAYYPLDETRNLANRTRNGQNIIKCYRDDIPKMIIEGNTQNDLWKRRDMSPLRRFCLVISILLCIVTILVFLYVLPCDTMICPPINESQSSVSWEKTLWNVEVHGPITIIPGSPYDLIFLLRGQEYNDSNTDNSSKTSRGSSIVSIHGTSGLYLWLVCLERVPTNIDCISIDTDRSGKTDCIVVGERGLLKSIDPTTGIIHWNSEVHTFPKLPVILPDLNSDGIEDLLSVELTQGNISSLVLLSGNTGQLLGKYIKHNCSLVNIYNLVSDGTILYLCHDMNGKRITKYVSLKALLNGSSLSQRKREITASPRIFKTMMLDEQNNYWKPTRYHRLMVENEGICSWESCKATLNLTLQKQPNQTLKIWEYVSPNSFASKPVFLITSQEPYSTGFVIKFWQWLDTNPSVTDTIPKIIERKLIERVLIVFVNYTDVQVINASQTDVTQLCNGTNCQPNLDLRVKFNSIAAANINQEGYPELVSYWSSYNNESPRMLTSKIEIVKIDLIISNLPRPNVQFFKILLNYANSMHSTSVGKR